MSNAVRNFVLSRKVGQTSAKQVLLRLADVADDQGTGIFISKSRVAAELEFARSTVQSAIKKLQGEGLITELGKRPCDKGYTYIYKINLDLLGARPPTQKNKKVEYGKQKDVLEASMSCTRRRHLDAQQPGTNVNRTQKNGKTVTNTIAEDRRKKNGREIHCKHENGRNGSLKMFAEKIKEGKWVAQSAITIANANEMMRLDLVTSEQLRSAGIVF